AVRDDPERGPGRVDEIDREVAARSLPRPSGDRADDLGQAAFGRLAELRGGQAHRGRQAAAPRGGEAGWAGPDLELAVRIGKLAADQDGGAARRRVGAVRQPDGDAAGSVRDREDRRDSEAT